MQNRGADLYFHDLKRSVTNHMAARLGVVCEPLNGWRCYQKGRHGGKIRMIIGGEACEFNYTYAFDGGLSLYEVFQCPRCLVTCRSLPDHQCETRPAPKPAEKRAKVEVSPIQAPDPPNLGSWLLYNCLQELEPKLLQEGFKTLLDISSLVDFSPAEVKELLGIDAASSARLISLLRIGLRKPHT